MGEWFTLLLPKCETSSKIYSACWMTAGESISDVTEMILLQHGHCNLPPDGLQFRDGSGPRHSEQQGQLALDTRSGGHEVRRSGGQEVSMHRARRWSVVAAR